MEQQYTCNMSPKDASYTPILLITPEEANVLVVLLLRVRLIYLEQQITCIDLREDVGNEWIIRAENYDAKQRDELPTEKIPIVNNGLIRLEHVTTGRKLHSHDHKAPVSETDQHKEVSGYGDADYSGDANDLWMVEFYAYDHDHPEAKENMTAMHTTFRLKHLNQNCHLQSRLKLPKWGFEQREVACMQGCKPINSRWRVVYNNFTLLTEHDKMVKHKVAGFWDKFYEFHYLANRADPIPDPCFKMATPGALLTGKQPGLEKKCINVKVTLLEPRRWLRLLVAVMIVAWIMWRGAAQLAAQAGFDVWFLKTKKSDERQAVIVLAWFFQLMAFQVNQGNVYPYDFLDLWTLSILLLVSWV